MVLITEKEGLFRRPVSAPRGSSLPPPKRISRPELGVLAQRQSHLSRNAYGSHLP
jgi:hypothetical protein